MGWSVSWHIITHTTSQESSSNIPFDNGGIDQSLIHSFYNSLRFTMLRKFQYLIILLLTNFLLIDSFLSFLYSRFKQREHFVADGDFIRIANMLQAATSSSCPFSKAFPRYRIELTKMTPKDDTRWFSVPFFSFIQNSASKRMLERRFKGAEIQWVSDDLERIEVFAMLWRKTANMVENRDQDCVVVLAFLNISQVQLVQHWLDIFVWMEQYTVEDSAIEAAIHKEGGVLVLELRRSGDRAESIQEPTISDDPSTLTKRTQSWVKRILVDEGICPFTKSVKMSGQGLGDLDVPVARIHYCSSDARCSQISKLMAGKRFCKVNYHRPHFVHFPLKRTFNAAHFHHRYVDRNIIHV